MNVNKLNTKATVQFKVSEANWIPDPIRTTFIDKVIKYTYQHLTIIYSITKPPSLYPAVQKPTHKRGNPHNPIRQNPIPTPQHCRRPPKTPRDDKILRTSGTSSECRCYRESEETPWESCSGKTRDEKEEEWLERVEGGYLECLMFFYLNKNLLVKLYVWFVVFVLILSAHLCWPYTL